MDRLQNTVSSLMITLVLYPLLPLGIYYLLKKEIESEYFFVLFDIKNSKAIYVDYKEFNKKLTKAHAMSLFYQSLNQISSN